MTPGPELDALVAEKVMGIAGDCPGDQNEWHSGWQCDTCWNTGMWGEDFTHAFKPYSASIAAAWEVVEKLATLLPDGDIHIERLDGEVWGVGTCHEASGWKGFISGKTAPHAICLAALKAVGVEVEQETAA